MEPTERAKKNLAAIFQRLASVGQANLAATLNVSESTISRWKTEEAEQVSRILAELGLKVVPVTLQCYEPKQLEAILTLAKARMETIHTAAELVWEEQ